jgi:hypothetical protein
MPRYQVFIYEQGTAREDKRGFSGKNRQNRQTGQAGEDHTSIAQEAANTSTSRRDAALGTSDGSKRLRLAHGGVTQSSPAVGRCETFDEEGGKLGSCSRMAKV